MKGHAGRRVGPHPAWIWLGLAVTLAAVYWTVRDVDIAVVAAAVRSATFWPLVAAAVLQLIGIYFRALRWRHLTAPLADHPLPLSAHLQATAVGFMAINIFPFRIGEIIRPWYLARKTGIRGTAALGTVLIERALDFAALAFIGAIVLYSHSASFPIWFQTGAYLFAVVSLLPVLVLVGLRIDEARTLTLLVLLVRPLPARLADRGLDLITELCRGLGTLHGLRPLLVVLFHTVLIWGLIFALPFALGLVALGIELPLADSVLAVYTVHAFTALAAAAPSAPGFLGVFHVACKEALALFGVQPEMAVAYGTVVHLAFWIPVTLAGVLVLARAGTRLSELASAEFGKAPTEPHR